MATGSKPLTRGSKRSDFNSGASAIINRGLLKETDRYPPCFAPKLALKIAPKGLDKPARIYYYGSVATQTSDFMTARQAAKQIGVHFTTIYRWVEARTILSINFGGILFIPKSEVERLKNEKARIQ